MRFINVGYNNMVSADKIVALALVEKGKVRYLRWQADP